MRDCDSGYPMRQGPADRLDKMERTVEIIVNWYSSGAGLWRNLISDRRRRSPSENPRTPDLGRL